MGRNPSGKRTPPPALRVRTGDLSAWIRIAQLEEINQPTTMRIVPPEGQSWIVETESFSTPEKTAAQFVGALGAHRYTGALNQLSDDLRQQVTEEDLRKLVQAVEQSKNGIQDAQGESSQEQGQGENATATATVKVKLGTNEEQTLQFPLKKEKGVWKLTSISPANSLP